MEIHQEAMVKAFREKTSSYVARIDEGLSKELETYANSRFYGPIMYAVGGGKRVRPLMVLFSVEALKNGIKEDPTDASVAVELLHTESIIHDDIIDEEVARRDKVTFHVKYGMNASILTADFVFGIILDIASRYKDPRIAQALSSAALRMCEGEFQELKIDTKLHKLRWHEYIELISRKTASLFETAARIGATLGGGRQEEIEALSSYGLQLGVAYQMQDDILDWGLEGSITGALELDPSIEDEIEFLKNEAAKQAYRAKEQLKILSSSTAKDILNELADFTINRQF